eukprot:SAG31_NODE_26301_length_444_cov_2.397101_1_plen_132_part_10
MTASTGATVLELLPAAASPAAAPASVPAARKAAPPVPAARKAAPPVPAATPSPAPAPAPAPAGKPGSRWKCVKKCQVRAGVAMDSEKAGILASGEEIEALEISGSRVRYSGGWVSVTASTGATVLELLPAAA